MNAETSSEVCGDDDENQNKNRDNNSVEAAPDESAKIIDAQSRGGGIGNEEKWDEMLNKLLEFREKHGNCLVPFRYADDRKLGIWVQTQRQQYRILMSGSSESTPMTPDRANRLEQIGFEWTPKEARSTSWEDRYKQLADFKEKYGHTIVPMRRKENVALSNWVSTQRQEYRLLQKGRKSRLTPNRLRLLENLGFVWEAKRGKRRSGEDSISSNTASIVVTKNEEVVESSSKSSEQLTSNQDQKHTIKRKRSLPSATTANTSLSSGEQVSPDLQQAAQLATQRQLELIRSMLSREHYQTEYNHPNLPPPAMNVFQLAEHPSSPYYNFGSMRNLPNHAAHALRTDAHAIAHVRHHNWFSQIQPSSMRSSCSDASLLTTDSHHHLNSILQSAGKSRRTQSSPNFSLPPKSNLVTTNQSILEPGPAGLRSTLQGPERLSSFGLSNQHDIPLHNVGNSASSFPSSIRHSATPQISPVGSKKVIIAGIEKQQEQKRRIAGIPTTARNLPMGDQSIIQNSDFRIADYLRRSSQSQTQFSISPEDNNDTKLNAVTKKKAKKRRHF